jgi:hypothetical protein
MRAVRRSTLPKEKALATGTLVATLNAGPPLQFGGFLANTDLGVDECILRLQDLWSLDQGLEGSLGETLAIRGIAENRIQRSPPFHPTAQESRPALWARLRNDLNSLGCETQAFRVFTEDFEGFAIILKKDYGLGSVRKCLKANRARSRKKIGDVPTFVGQTVLENIEESLAIAITRRTSGVTSRGEKCSPTPETARYSHG